MSAAEEVYSDAYRKGGEGGVVSKRCSGVISAGTSASPPLSLDALADKPPVSDMLYGL
jgi:hypothetical protein